MSKLTIADTNAKISETNSKLEKHEAVCAERWRETTSVRYTHLTLPTKAQV